MSFFNLFVAAAGLVVGLTCGFVLANNSFRVGSSHVGNANIALARPLEKADSVEVGERSALDANSADSLQLSASEIKQAIAQADSLADNLKFQRDIGLALYQYAVVESQLEVLPDIIRILKRVDDKGLSQDVILLNALGESLLIVGAQNADQEKLREARSVFERMQAREFRNADLLFKIGLTFQLTKPANWRRSLDYFEKALEIDARHEKATESMTAALIGARELERAAQTLNRLKSINPQNSAISDLEIQIAQAKLEH